MTSARKITANRINGRKSRGPRTRPGKASVSRNAFRHGLATISYRNPAFVAEIERMAKAICGGDSRPFLLERALVIAENEFLRQCVLAQRVAVIERLRDGTAIPLVKGDNRLALAKARRRQTDLACAELQRIKARLHPNSAQEPYYSDQWTDVEFDALCTAPPNLEGHARYEQESAPPAERDEVDALCAALPDLMRLARYERRAWSRQKRATREFLEMKSCEGDVKLYYH